VEVEIKEACGVCGGWAAEQPLAYLTCFALYALQHRGQESAGIAVGSGEGGKIWLKKGPGLVSEVFPDTNELKRHHGSLALGHVRYAYGREELGPENSQPLLLRYRHGELAIVHNGCLVNGELLRDELAREGAIFQTETDSELLGPPDRPAEQPLTGGGAGGGSPAPERGICLYSQRREKGDRLARSAWIPTALPGAAGLAWIFFGLRDLCLRHHRSAVCPRTGSGRGGGT